MCAAVRQGRGGVSVRFVTEFAIERRDTHTAPNKTKHTRYARVIIVMVGLVKRRAQVAHELKRESNPPSELERCCASREGVGASSREVGGWAVSMGDGMRRRRHRQRDFALPALRIVGARARCRRRSVEGCLVEIHGWTPTPLEGYQVARPVRA